MQHGKQYARLKGSRQSAKTDREQQVNREQAELTRAISADLDRLMRELRKADKDLALVIVLTQSIEASAAEIREKAGN